MPRWVWLLIKLAVAALVVAVMVRQGVLKFEVDDLLRALGRWPWLVVALVSLLLGVFLQSIRWGLLLRPHGIELSPLRLFQLTMTGIFFTMVGPGGIGGDAVKAFLVARGRDRRTAAATTVLLDRVLGLLTLFAVAGVMTLLNLGRLWHARIEWLNWFGLPGGRMLVFLIVGVTVGVLVGATVLVSKRLRATGLLSRATAWVPFRSTVQEVYRSVHLYRDHPRALISASAVSMVAQLPFYLVYYLYGLAVGADVEFWHCALIVPPAMVIRVLPILPGGAGQGTVAMGLLFPLVGVAAAKGAAVGTIGDALFITLYLIGGLFFLSGGTRIRDLRAAGAEDSTP
jgi:hypothetical protein